MAKTVAAPRSLSGLWGEALTVRELRRHDFEVDWKGGLTAGKDLVVSRGGQEWFVQVKSTQKANGRIAWGRPGQPARDLDARAQSAGAAGAFFVLVQLWTLGDSRFDLDTGVLTITEPPDAKLVGLSALKFADDVDSERARYAATTRGRVGRKGEAKGTLHREDGVIYPLSTGDYPYLSEYVETLG